MAKRMSAVIEKHERIINKAHEWCRACTNSVCGKCDVARSVSRHSKELDRLNRYSQLRQR